jgi:hypothetical protein
MRFNFSWKISDHYENFYCLSLSFEEFDESFADYLNSGGSYHPKVFLSTFFCMAAANISQGLIKEIF